MKLYIPRPNKMVKSAIISFLSLVALVLLKKYFPSFNWVQYESSILTAIGAWLVVLVKETLGL